MWRSPVTASVLFVLLVFAFPSSPSNFLIKLRRRGQTAAAAATKSEEKASERGQRKSPRSCYIARTATATAREARVPFRIICYKSAIFPITWALAVPPADIHIGSGVPSRASMWCLLRSNNVPPPLFFAGLLHST